MHQEIPLNINLEINNKRLDCKIGTAGGYSWEGQGEWRRLRWENMADRLHTQNRTMKSLEIALSGARGSLGGEKWGWSNQCTIPTYLELSQQIHPNK
jgi:hypothetical protein